MPETARPLARGRRSSAAMSAAEVAADQRDRMLTAMTAAAAELGFSAVTLNDITTRAKVSRATFYQQFTDKADCFLEAYERAISRLVGAVGGSSNAPATPRGLVERYLDALLAEPDEARLFLHEINALGEQGIVRRARNLHASADLLAQLLDRRSEADRFACEAFSAAVVTMASMALATDGTAGVRALREPLTDLADRLFGAPPRPL